MFAVVTFVCALASPQLRVEPFPATVGQAVVVRMLRDGQPVGGVEIIVEMPDGARWPCGSTGTDGCLPFAPETPGYHVFHANVDGVHVVAPLPVLPARARWPLALATVPLGVALLWWNLRRARDRRGS